MFLYNFQALYPWSQPCISPPWPRSVPFSAWESLFILLQEGRAPTHTPTIHCPFLCPSHHHLLHHQPSPWCKTSICWCFYLFTRLWTLSKKRLWLFMSVSPGPSPGPGACLAFCKYWLNCRKRPKDMVYNIAWGGICNGEPSILRPFQNNPRNNVI